MVDALETMLALAKAGEVMGLMYSADLKGDSQRPMHGLCGSYRREPLRALGVLLALKARLVKLVDSCQLSGFGNSR